MSPPPSGVGPYNRHLVLEPVLGAIARAAGLAALTRNDARVADAERRAGKVFRDDGWGQTLTSKQF